jgi:hypothetical protein
MESLDAWRGRMISGLLSAQQPDGAFGGHPYRKWTGAHWRLVSLVEEVLGPGPLFVRHRPPDSDAEGGVHD